MSSKVKNHDSASGVTVVVTGAKLFGVRRRLVLLCVASVVVLAGVTAGTYALVNTIRNRSHAASKATDGSTLSHPIPQSSEQVVETKALNLAVVGKYDEAQAYLDSQIAATTDKGTQASYYLDKSSVAASNSDAQGALQFAQKAESLKPTAASADAIAVNAETLGDKATALKYYQLERTRNNGLMLKEDKAALDEKIKSLGGV